MNNNIEHQYLQLLKDILWEGTYKPAAREGMPGTKSLFGYQMRHDLSKGFPLLTTKQMSFKNIVVELLWFLKGDTNIKFLVENGCNIWNQDAYAYYCKLASKNTDSSWNAIYMGIHGGVRVDVTQTQIVESYSMFTFEEFCAIIKNNTKEQLQKDFSCNNYTLGDCGYQYGKVWRNWDSDIPFGEATSSLDIGIDQIKNVLTSLKNNPEGRRHIVTAVDPAHDQDLALYWCHSLFQFNCRPIPWEEKLQLAMKNSNVEMENLHITEAAAGSREFGIVPQYYLDCQVYIRSNDLFLGAPYNIASYALIIEFFSRILNMIPGELVYTIGDAHIYENHFEQVKQQLQRQPLELSRLNINTEFWGTESGECGVGNLSIDSFLESLQEDNFIKCLIEEDIQLSNYTSHPRIKGGLSTGIKKTD